MKLIGIVRVNEGKKEDLRMDKRVITKLSKNAIRKYLRYDIVPQEIKDSDLVFLKELKKGKCTNVDMIQYFCRDWKFCSNYNEEKNRIEVSLFGYTIYTRKCNYTAVSWY
ncbi:MAG: hypothetical protein ACRC0G_13265 [Fusobacteriaceae bacterium]